MVFLLAHLAVLAPAGWAAPFLSRMTKAQKLAGLWELIGERPPKRRVKYDLAKLHDVAGRRVTQAEAALIFAMAARGVREVFDFCLVSGQHTFNARLMQYAMRRFVAIAWLLHSEMMRGPDGNILTLAQLAKLPQLDCTKVALSLSAQRFADQFRFHTRIQKRRGTKETYAAAAKIGWQKRRARAAARSKARSRTRAKSRSKRKKPRP